MPDGDQGRISGQFLATVRRLRDFIIERVTSSSGRGRGAWPQVSASQEVGQAHDIFNLSPGINTMYIVAHPDDSLLFQSPSLFQSIRGGHNCLTVHLTAGDNGMDVNYWVGREAGIRAAYAHMAGATDRWTETAMIVEGHRVTLNTLDANPGVMVAFMRLPDGSHPSGRGTRRYRFHSLMKLWLGSQRAISSVDGSASYGRWDLIGALVELMRTFQPQLVAVQDYDETFGCGDHMDHYAAANFARAAHLRYSSPHNFVGYKGYGTSSLAANVSGEPLAAKQAIFYTYGRFDPLACSSAIECSATPYEQWLQREYVVGSEPVGVVANAGFAQTVAAGTKVQLDGSMSCCQGGDVITYAWAQEDGAAVSLSSPAAKRPTFVAPMLGDTLIFALKVAGGAGTSADSRVTVTVIAEKLVITSPGDAVPGTPAG